MSMEQSLFQALAVLGSSADEVADRLYEMGFRGRQTDAHGCPLAQYLQATTHRPVVVASMMAECYGRFFPLPEPCSQFVELFDAGKWPLLVEDAHHAPECPNLPDDCRCSG